jgi:hypothetical protein
MPWEQILLGKAVAIIACPTPLRMKLIERLTKEKKKYDDEMTFDDGLETNGKSVKGWSYTGYREAR